MFSWRFLAAATLLVRATAQSSTCAAPTVTITNGTYVGLSVPNYGQEFFLGIPYAQPPLGDLRFAIPHPLNATWPGTHNATAYYPECVGYGGDDIGYQVSEDCLALNVIRPAGYEGQSLPVAVWIHGGGYVMGGTPDRRYNLTFMVQNSVTIGKPIIGVSLAYRLSGWGFLDGAEIRAAGATNLGIRDQYLALQWLQENIAAFGGNPSKVTIWGESAGGESVGSLLTLYGGRDDKLFAGAISESGTPLLQGGIYSESIGQAKYDNITAATGCSNASNSLSCLRSLPFDTLNKALNITPSYLFSPYVDNDTIKGSIYEQLLKGQFIKVPYLIGTNADEGSAFGPQGVNNDTAFEAYLNTTGADYETVKTLEIIYPNIDALGVLDTYNATPPADVPGTQFKRVAAFAGDYTFIAARRLTCQQWTKYGVNAYAYRFNVIVNNLTALIGVTHFQARRPPRTVM